ncbi:hypothetical protein [Paracoccus tegillarcae]|uniref:Uncharacterized protein n=1 Tax=Paracoccus tegillarcae TaxID=1529068 RepID=A0A2K9EV22_9RHOB|nr:hypothetical protein [Paracoccus tegillarcae]AUH35625.1 hypothetical protein CUV01_18780 [Paracoccus tegillarcae]
MRPGIWLIGLLAFSGPTLGQDRICVPPEEPFMPDDDATFSEYADIVAEDFERYFSEFSPYIACLDAARLEAFARAREISTRHQAFWDRADRMGLTEEAAPYAE